jgi:DNA uptake protein ComE-like DNA-binding protein
VGRTLAGAVLLLAVIVLARGPSMVTGMKQQSGPVPQPADSSRPLAPQSKEPPSASSSKRPLVPRSFTRAPLAFLSRAPVDSLILLNGIGPVLAERIVEARTGKGPFSSWEEILAIKGIGQKKLETLKNQAGIVD